MRIRSLVPTVVSAGVALALAMLTASAGVASAAGAAPATGTGGPVVVLTSLDMFGPTLEAIRQTAPAGEVTTSSFVPTDTSIFVPTEKTPRSPSLLAVRTVIIAGYSPVALPWVIGLARAIGPHATIEVISIPASSTHSQKVNAIGQAMYGVGIPVSPYVSLAR